MEIQLKVTGMTCAHCIGAVKKALEQVPGVESTQVSLDQEQAIVTGDADTEALITAVKEEGYHAEVQ
jgi:copper chaperone